MKIEPVEHKWIYPEMKEMFDKLAQLRDEVWAQCRAELGDDLPETATAPSIASRRIVRDERRRAEIVESYRQIAAGYERKLADLMARYTTPQIFMTPDQPKE